MLQLDQENADRNLTSLVTVLTHTPDANNPRLCVAHIAFGDGTKNLSGAGGTFQLQVEVGGQTLQPAPQSVTFGTAVRAGVYTFAFPVPANQSVVVKALSPNGADTDVDVTATLYDMIEDVYHADIEVTKDAANTQDEYTATWFRNGLRVTSGITSPTIQVVKRADGTDLIASTAMTQIGSTGSHKYDASGASRLTDGEAALVIVAATINGSSRSFSRVLGRDDT